MRLRCRLDGLCVTVSSEVFQSEVIEDVEHADALVGGRYGLVGAERETGALQSAMLATDGDWAEPILVGLPIADLLDSVDIQRKGRRSGQVSARISW